jgi:ABC-type iron transport system FetAB permease component
MVVIRCVAQLTVLGYILVPIFNYDYWWLVIGYSGIMLLVGALEANGRPMYHYKVRFGLARIRGSLYIALNLLGLITLLEEDLVATVMCPSVVKTYE